MVFFVIDLRSLFSGSCLLCIYHLIITVKLEVRDLGELFDSFNSCVAAEMERAVGHLGSNNWKNGIQVSTYSRIRGELILFLH